MTAPDIFLSYNREDAARAKHFAEAFAAEGLDVWWDVALRSGEAYDEVTENALHEAKAVVVLWSPRSVVSRWVRSEATIADQNKTLVPAMIEPCRRSVMFELVQTAELSHWNGDAADPAWQGFVARVREVLGKPAETAPARVSARTPAQTSVVVLPFANMSNDPEQEYFADGISEDIITDLSKVSSLLVIARNTAFTFKGKHVDIKDVARQLDVTHVLEGSVRKAGNRLRITAQLIDGATGGHVWAERYDRDLADIFEIQDELSEAIVGALQVRLLPKEKEAILYRGSASPQAYDIYIRARSLRAAPGAGNVERAIEIYREAVVLDPDFAMAWAGLASALNQSLIFELEDPQQRVTEANAALSRAMELEPDLPETVSSRAWNCIQTRDWQAAEQCIAYFTSRTDSFWTIIAALMLVMGRANESAEYQYKVTTFDPLSPGGSVALQMHLDMAHRFAEADLEYQRSLDLATLRDPFEWNAVTRRMAQGRDVEARQLFRAHFASSRYPMPFAPELAELLDDDAKAREFVCSAIDDPGNQAPAVQSALAHWARFFDDADSALKAFRRAMIEKGGIMRIGFWHPNFAPLHGDPRFKQMVIDLGLANHWRKTGNWGDFARPVGDDDFEIVG